MIIDQHITTYFQKNLLQITFLALVF